MIASLLKINSSLAPRTNLLPPSRILSLIVIDSKADSSKITIPKTIKKNNFYKNELQKHLASFGCGSSCLSSSHG